MLNSLLESESIVIDGFSKDVFRNDHPSSNKIGGVCLYYRERLLLKCRKDFECLQEMVSKQSGFRPSDSAINQRLALAHNIYCAF